MGVGIKHRPRLLLFGRLHHLLPQGCFSTSCEKKDAISSLPMGSSSTHFYSSGIYGNGSGFPLSPSLKSYPVSSRCEKGCSVLKKATTWPVWKSTGMSLFGFWTSCRGGSGCCRPGPQISCPVVSHHLGGVFPAKWVPLPRFWSPPAHVPGFRCYFRPCLKIQKPTRQWSFPVHLVLLLALAPLPAR